MNPSHGAKKAFSPSKTGSIPTLTRFQCDSQARLPSNAVEEQGLGSLLCSHDATALGRPTVQHPKWTEASRYFREFIPICGQVECNSATSQCAVVFWGPLERFILTSQ